MNGSPLGLGPLESAIMALLWETGDWLTITAIRSRMEYQPVAYSTVATVAEILYRKGQARRRRVAVLGRRGQPGWQYHAAQPLDEHVGQLIGVLLDCCPDPDAALRRALAARHTGVLPKPHHAAAQNTRSGEEQE